ncbi:fibronectin type III domain-containing protein [Cytophagaceae bacterium ABcell3]|nr:fibronectin type III domain-containing protein [Cytophagaceae bacterium ABcell3]
MDSFKYTKYYHILRCIIGLAFFVITPNTPLFSSSNTPSFDGDLTQYSNDGHIRISWEAQKAENSEFQFELQRSEKEDFSDATIIYKGPETATFTSGLSNGTYFFRIRTNNNNNTSQWSEPMQLIVEHHSLNKALWLAALGATVVLATVAVIVTGNRKQEH